MVPGLKVPIRSGPTSRLGRNKKEAPTLQPTGREDCPANPHEHWEGRLISSGSRVTLSVRCSPS